MCFAIGIFSAVFWRDFPKFAKIGPEYPLSSGRVFRRFLRHSVAGFSAGLHKGGRHCELSQHVTVAISTGADEWPWLSGFCEKGLGFVQTVLSMFVGVSFGQGLRARNGQSSSLIALFNSPESGIMEFSCSNQTQALRAECSSANKNVGPNPTPSEGLERGGQGQVPSFRGLTDYNVINLGGNDDNRRALNPLSVASGSISPAMNSGQSNPTGSATVNGVDSEMMISLDDILDDLQKKVTSVEGNVYDVKGQSLNPLERNTRKPAVQEAGNEVMEVTDNECSGEGAVLQRANANFKSEIEGANEKGEARGSQGLLYQCKGELGAKQAANEQYKGEVTAGSGRANEHYKREPEVMQRTSEPYRAEVAGLQGTGEQYRAEVTGSQQIGVQYRGEVAGPQRMGEVAGPEQTGEQLKCEASYPQETSEQCRGEDVGLQGTSEHYKGEVAGSQGTSEQEKGEAPGTQGTIEQSKSGTANSLVIQPEKPVGHVVGGELEAIFHTPAPTDRSKQKSRRHTELVQSPDWLPKGWSTELKTRGGGSSAGTKDKYYYDPVSNRRFRSRAEVFNFLETGKVGRYKPKIKSEGEVGRKRKASDVLSQNASSLDHSIRPTKVRWVLNDSEGSWIPFISEEELNEFNRKEGERFFDLNRNSADACDYEQGKSMVSKNANPSKSPKNDIMEVGIDLSEDKKVSEDVMPFVDSWSDPCLEFAVKTLTGAFPVLEENLPLQHALQNYFLPQTNAVQNLWSDFGKSNPLGSDAFPDLSGCSHRAEHPFLAEAQLTITKELHGSNSLQNILSPPDSVLECPLNSYTHRWSEKKLVRQQAKDLLEPLGRKLCNQALDFLKGSRHSSMYLGKQAKNISMSFHLSRNFSIDYGHQEHSIFNSSFG
eukprot:Gb_12376 [translate_table: standard]